ncbi:hydrophobin, partial [Flammula alnicola]
PQIDNSCNTGPVQCCNQLMDSKSEQATLLASLIGLDLGAITGQVGAQCSPITAIGVGSGASCSSQPVCCSNNSFNGLIAVGCSPVNLGL